MQQRKSHLYFSMQSYQYQFFGTILGFLACETNALVAKSVHKFKGLFQFLMLGNSFLQIRLKRGNRWGCNLVIPLLVSWGLAAAVIGVNFRLANTLLAFYEFVGEDFTPKEFASTAFKKMRPFDPVGSCAALMEYSTNCCN